MSNISLKDFLKKYTAISSKFINEYYKFYEMCENNIFGINAEDIIKYLGITFPKKFYERLREKYIINSDYIIIRTNNKSTKGIKDANYFVSFDTFEKICMISRTETGNRVRDYFITLRKFINYYKHHFADKINNLTLDHKYMYILLVNKGKNIFKLGRSKDIRKRLKSYATGKDIHPDIQFIMIVDDPIKVESCAKLFTTEFKYKGRQELYKIDIDLLKETIFKCAEIHKNIIDKIQNDDNIESYVVFDDSKTIQYLDISNNIIDYEKKSSKKKSSKKKSSKKKLSKKKLSKNQ